MKCQPIGIIDSGIGGLTVVKAVMELLPQEKICYLGDQKRCPYGPKSAQEVIQYTEEMAIYLYKTYHIKLLVIACNTATAVALALLQKKLPIPVIGVIEPGVDAALKYSQQQKIALIATEGTVRSGAYQELMHQRNPKSQLVSVACPELVQLIEQDFTKHQLIQSVIKQCLEQVELDYDTLILGCTHFPIVAEDFKAVMGPQIQLVDAGAETGFVIQHILQTQHQLSQCLNPKHIFLTTGSFDQFKRVLDQWLPVTEMEIKQIVLEKELEKEVE